jgi:hypothetical protein
MNHIGMFLPDGLINSPEGFHLQSCLAMEIDVAHTGIQVFHIKDIFGVCIVQDGDKHNLNISFRRKPVAQAYGNALGSTPSKRKRYV